MYVAPFELWFYRICYVSDTADDEIHSWHLGCFGIAENVEIEITLVVNSPINITACERVYLIFTQEVVEEEGEVSNQKENCEFHLLLLLALKKEICLVIALKVRDVFR